MATIALAAVGLLGGGFMLYVLFQWTGETVRNRSRSAATTMIFATRKQYAERPHLMVEPLDIFVKMEDGTYVWKAAADSFELAKSTVQRLATTSPGEYMIFNQITGNKIVVNRDGLPEPGAAS
jgi:hypothetical protein